MSLDSGALNTSNPMVDGGDIDTIKLPGLVSGELYWHIMSVALTLSGVVSIFATGANIVTILVYYKLGFNDTTNISLTALAISDLGVAVTTLVSVLAILLPLIPNAPFTSDIFITTGPAPHNFFARVSALITTYLSVERYLCVSLPLKVKSIFTPKRTFIAMAAIFAGMFSLYPFVVLRYPVGWVFFPDLNKTLLSIPPVTDQNAHTFCYFLVTYISFFLPPFTFFTVLFTTVSLSLVLKKSKQWRDANKSMAPAQTTAAESTGDGSAASPASKPTLVTKEARAVKMVIAITTVFIVATIPSCIHMVVLILVPEFDFGRRYANMYAITGMLFLCVDCINCSANVIIYYKMSSKFRQAMQCLYSRQTK
ncbi:chemosensory receptor B [Elysia marginata]|uniref:Chemosensory receptor B n=1 Tax=Elysia marginata TaxID=1093978 RepID=A0AAV4IS02_9GAST|nr:chemosensory receptor B [Elysia marginata]